MLDKVDTAFSYGRELVVYSYLQDLSKGKGSSLPFICKAHTAFLLCTAEMAEQDTGPKLWKNLVE